MAGSGVDLSDEELLDALWLAACLPRDVAPLARTGASTSRPGQPDLGHRSPSPTPQDSAPAADGPDSAPLEDPQPDRPMHAAPETDESGLRVLSPRRAFAVRAPDSRALSAREFRLGKSLRPLRQRFPDRRRHELDIARTVAAMAETGLPETVTRPTKTRWLSLVLLVDDGISMVLWQRLAAEVRTLMERAGAFRDVRVHGLDTRSPRAPLLSTRPFQGRGPYQSPTSVSDPTGDTLVLVISDGVGEAWWDGRMREAMDFWARRGPTAIVHALPTRLWANTGITAQRWQVTSHHRGGPTTTWQLDDPVLPPGLLFFNSVPVPVLEPSPTAIADWARLVASPGTTTLLPVWHNGESPKGRLFTDTRHVDDAQAVLRFRDAASPEAYRLAGHLAAVAPLTPPVMRLVQGALGAPTDHGHIVEVFLGGLMRQVNANKLTRLPHHRLFDFTEEARRILLGAIPPQELLRTTRAVADLLEATAGRSPNFPAWVSHPDGSAVIGEAGQSFGWLKERLLRRLGVPQTSPAPTATSLAQMPESAAGGLGGTSGAPEVQPPEVPPGWSPLRPQDARRLGPYRLFARSDRGWLIIVVYLALDESGETVTVRAPAPLYSLSLRQGRELILAEANCLARMDGVHAPRLLEFHAGDAGHRPWLASAYLRRRDDDKDSGPAPDLRAVFKERRSPVGALFQRVGRDLARAVSRAHSLNLVHGALVPKTVLVTDHDVWLIGWMTATRDGEHSDHLHLFPRSETCFQAPDDIAGPTRESDMYSVGALLLACATGRWTDLEADAALRQALEESGIDAPIADTLWRCLDPNPSARPTADELAEVFTRVSDDLADGRREDALVAISETVAESRELARQDPDVHRPHLASLLNELSNRLGEAGRREEALAAITESVGMYQDLRGLRPQIYRQDLARVLNNLAVRLSDVGRRAEALSAISESVELYRELGRQDPAVHLPNLATTLNILSDHLGETGRREDALAAITEAVDLYRVLARQQPDLYRPDLARGLNNLAVRLGDSGQQTEALAAITEAVEIRRQLTKTRPELHEADLEQSLRVNAWLRTGGGQMRADS
ncbi:SAV_2336 N-terminal domain-related protein [Streptomyces barkulensis]|uniref:SAV_2336 N-terminal domain-related protein n=1 Tax=Streptomyces barkulensis TaxID=1257026 RepID=UPI0023F7BEF7|nr:SAV_2336 N-terminal domain-related protein [Streptomyces barkulensis]